GIKYGAFVVAGIIVYNLISTKLSKKMFWIFLSVSIAVICAVPIELLHQEQNAEVLQKLEKHIETYQKDPTEAEWNKLCAEFSLDPVTLDIDKDDYEKLQKEVIRTKTLQDNTEIKMGTDLNGGFEIMYEVIPVEGRKEAYIDDGTLDIIRERINNSGLTGNTVQSVGKNRILVQVPGYNKDEVVHVKNIIKKRGHLAFRLVSSNNLETDKYIKIKEDNEKAKLWNKAHPEQSPKQMRPYPEEYELMELTEIVDKDGEEKKQKELLLVSKTEHLTGDDLSEVYKIQTDDRGRPAVGLDFTLMGRKRMAQVTGNNRGERLAIVLDGELKSAPRIQQRITRSARITGDFTHEEVDSTIDILRAGSLDIKMKELSEYSVDASLGKRSITGGIRSMVYALLAVLVFMCIYYLKAGCIADATLFFNLILIIGGLSLFQVTLTLPGIAGLLLTVGMSVDANIIIFERIREEINKRKSDGEGLGSEEISAAVEKGYKSAFWTIFDANITTLITALILLIVGTGAIKGFAITLSIGIIGSMFSALIISKAFFQVLLAAGWFSRGIAMLGVLTNPAFVFVSGKVRSGKKEEESGKGFFPLQWKFQTLSIILVISSIVIFFMQGDSKYGVDFNGGSITKVAFTSDINAELLRKGLADQFPNVKVQRFYDPEKGKQNTFSIYLPTTDEPEKITGIFKTVFQQEPAAVTPFTVTSKQQDEFKQIEWTAFASDTKKPFALENPKDRAVFFRDFDEAYIINARGTFPPAEKILELLPPNVFAKGGIHSSKDKLIIVLSLKKDRERLKNVLEKTYTDKLAPEGFTTVEKDPSGTFRIGLVLEKELTTEVLKAKLSAPVPEAIQFTSIDVGSLKGTSVELNLTPDDKDVTVHDVKEEVKSRLPVSRRFLGDNAIGSTVASELRERGIIAIILALIAIVIYITIRFEFNFSIGAVTALVHDVAITVGIVILTDSLGIIPIKIDLTILAAMLTIIGYSLNDTIVVFDRIREQFPLKDNRHQKSQALPRTRIANLIDEGINGTLSRTILTSLTTLLVTLSLLFFGGGVIQGFAFALTIGVIVGTYSSIFVASPVVLLVHWLRDKNRR
ncbi:protein translocase subunit SecD, partial [Planctomycetota bacterium]